MILNVHQRQKHRIFLFRFMMSAPVLESGPNVPRPYRNSRRKKKYKFMDKMSFMEIYKEAATQNENHNPGAESGMYTKRQ